MFRSKHCQLSCTFVPKKKSSEKGLWNFSVRKSNAHNNLCILSPVFYLLSISLISKLFVTVLNSVNYFSNDWSNCNDELAIEQKNTWAFLSWSENTVSYCKKILCVLSSQTWDNNKKQEAATKKHHGPEKMSIGLDNSNELKC